MRIVTLRATVTGAVYLALGSDNENASLLFDAVRERCINSSVSITCGFGFGGTLRRDAHVESVVTKGGGAMWW